MKWYLATSIRDRPLFSPLRPVAESCLGAVHGQDPETGRSPDVHLRRLD